MYSQFVQMGLLKPSHSNVNLICKVCTCFRKTDSRNRTMIIQCVYKWMVQFQKLTRNLFLTLHGHNARRQQRQLSKFLMRYQQFAFHAYCRAAESVYKMAPQQEKAFCVLRFEVSRSVIAMQRAVQCAVYKRRTMHGATLETGPAAPQ